MKKVKQLWLLYSCFALTGCESIVKGTIDGIVTIDKKITKLLSTSEYYRTSVKPYFCYAKNGKCKDPNRKLDSMHSELILSIANDNSYMQYLKDMWQYFIPYQRINKDNIDTAINNLELFIEWASLSPNQRALEKESYQQKIKGRFVGDLLVVYQETPFIALNREELIGSDVLLMLDIVEARNMKNEILTFKKILTIKEKHNDKNL